MKITFRRKNIFTLCGIKLKTLKNNLNFSLVYVNILLFTQKSSNLITSSILLFGEKYSCLLNKIQTISLKYLRPINLVLV